MEKILETLWREYVESGLDGIKALSIGSLDQANEQLTEFLKSKGMNLNLHESADLDSIIGEFTYIAEKCGFLNGIKVGFRLCQEMNKDSWH
ncbi:MAG: hypothetical protein K2N38_08415 [Oscillospiraceae bacterium]|nr:hypothetical protein [Oscillospiraceae bacterium]